MQSAQPTACRFSLALLLLTLVAIATTTAAPLEWRRGTTSTKPVATGDSPVTRTAREPRVTTARATAINPLRSTQRRVDNAVRQAAFEDDRGPEFRSVIVEREDSQLNYRPANFSTGSSSGASGGAGASSSAGAGSTSTGAAGAQGAAGAPGSSGVSDISAPSDISTPSDVGGPADATSPVTPTRPPSGFGTPGADPATELPPLEDMPLEELETPPTTPGTDRMQAQPGQPVQPPTRFPGRVPREPVGELPPTPPLSEATIESENQKSDQACEQGLDDLREHTIDKISLSIAVTGEQGSDYPFECTLDEGAWHGGRCWEQTTYMWKASALCHKPLYFEDEQLERYGHSFSPCFQPFISGAHFFTRPFVLPYCMGVEPPCECVYALGHYRPGNCAPYMCNPIPISPRGALFQAGASVGTAAILP